ncbi:shikimate dehydrogenase [Schumannella sp. 10F1B-5-1]|uniref:shikimate dehydrogenase family protein n=1 Tax=Schumannella sp. 10F1B-5-1 TaxID=2590780 RepID=UPI0011305BD9|nr:shikimate dehydrogenase [Schumannella sp. 10F1B-5-1]TPW71046.1 shikimate dehydrogenase [Schumannella sp. 10F1B-5-1]
MSGASRRLAVLGSPIGHSQSPALHQAAYRVLGLDWDYGRAEVTDETLADFLAGLGPDWLGLSLTMPLKRRLISLADDAGWTVDPVARATGQANTLLLDPAGPRAYNTDVDGIVDAVRESGGADPRRVLVLGGGATARSAVEAARVFGAEVVLAARAPERVADAGSARVVALGDARPGEADLVVSTIPGGVDIPVAVPALRPEQLLLDVVYHPWPTPLAARWQQAGGGLVHGLGMLLHQAVRQIRIFRTGDPGAPLPDETAVLAAMRAAVGR